MISRLWERGEMSAVRDGHLKLGGCVPCCGERPFALARSLISRACYPGRPGCQYVDRPVVATHPPCLRSVGISLSCCKTCSDRVLTLGFCFTQMSSYVGVLSCTGQNPRPLI